MFILYQDLCIICIIISMIRTRFAPSPTGGLHIGSVRTVLFNWLYAKHCNGQFLLRIEDTDRERSKSEHVEDIYRTLKWLNLNWDEEPIFQLQNIKRHQEVANDLLSQDKAYRCYCTPQELEEMREIARKEGRTPKYDRRCRDLKEELDKPYVVRLKAKLTGSVEFVDLIQGHCKVDNEHMDDMILLRSDGTPTYMLAVVVDDHDMKITHVIRASEHLNNAYRQKQIYNSCGWDVPEFAHVSLVHGEDGAKLSKRHGATTLDEFEKEGFLPEAILNYLVRLGWSKGDEEIMSIEECIKAFDIKDVRSSAAQFSMHKLLSVNSIYLNKKDNAEVLQLLQNFAGVEKYDDAGWKRIFEGMDELKSRIRTLKELANMSNIYGNDGSYFASVEKSGVIVDLIDALDENHKYSVSEVKELLNIQLEKNGTTLKEAAPSLRLALTKEKVAPSIFELIVVLGPMIVKQRLTNAIK